MELKWYFRDEPTPFLVSNHLSHLSHPGVHQRPILTLEALLSQIGHGLFWVPDKCLTYCNLTKEQWQAIRSLADDRSSVIKKADKGPCIVFWDRDYYLSKAKKQLCDKSIYKDVSFNEKMFSDLVASNSKLFKSLERKEAISEKEMKYFLYNYKKRH